MPAVLCEGKIRFTCECLDDMICKDPVLQLRRTSRDFVVLAGREANAEFARRQEVANLVLRHVCINRARSLGKLYSAVTRIDERGDLLGPNLSQSVENIR